MEGQVSMKPAERTITETLYRAYLEKNEADIRYCIRSVTDECVNGEEWSYQNALKWRHEREEFIVKALLHERDMDSCQQPYRSAENSTPVFVCIDHDHLKNSIVSQHRPQVDMYLAKILELLLSLCGRPKVAFDVNTMVWGSSKLFNAPSAALYCAMIKQLTQCTLVLFKYGADIECVHNDLLALTDVWRHSPAYIESIVRQISSNQRFKVCNIQVNRGMTLLHLVCKEFIHAFANQETFTAILKHTADINCVDKYGNSPLLCVLDIYDYEVFKFPYMMELVKLGSDLNIVNHDGATPLSSAILIGDKQIYNILVQHGARSLGYMCMQNTKYRQTVNDWLQDSTFASIYSIGAGLQANCCNIKELFTCQSDGSPLMLNDQQNRAKLITKSVWSLIGVIVERIELSTDCIVRPCLAGSCRDGTKLGLLDEFDIRLLFSNEFTDHVRFANVLYKIIQEIKYTHVDKHIHMNGVFDISGPAFKLDLIIVLPNVGSHQCSVDLVPVIRKKYNSKGMKCEYEYVDRYNEHAKQVIEHICNDSFYIKLVSGDPEKSLSLCRQELQLMKTVKHQYKLGYIMAKFINMSICTGHIFKSRLSNNNELMNLFKEGSRGEYCNSYELKMSHFEVLDEIRLHGQRDITGGYPIRRRYKQRRRPDCTKNLSNDPNLMVQSLIQATNALRVDHIDSYTPGRFGLYSTLGRIEGAILYRVTENYDAQNYDEISVTKGDVLSNVKWIGSQYWTTGFKARYVYGTVESTGRRGLLPVQGVETAEGGFYRLNDRCDAREKDEDDALCDGNKREMIHDTIDKDFVLATVKRSRRRGLIPANLVQIQS